MSPKSLLAICVGFGAGGWFAFQAARRTLAFNRALWWPGVRGTILESVEYRDEVRNGRHFRVRYEYTVNGERFIGSTPRLCGDWFWGLKEQTAFVARYAPGQEVEVFHDPANPRISCLDRTDRSGISAMWIIAVGATGLAAMLVWLDQAG
ncbi:MAG TPA: DUF3592 domain-containing protein [Opitutaceae bacterium]|nr:DUF3592 domain-containing protein [Opitutaceae bacterium]